jgi:hypothetical protein
MDAVEEYIANYVESDAERIAFAWNGKHATEFVDTNQDFRWQVIRHCVAHPESASVPLLEALIRADAAWSREAWCSPNHFDSLARVLLVCGREAALDTFTECFLASFDTFGACHQMELPPELLSELTSALRQRIAAAANDNHCKRLESVLELFEKLAQGTAAKGWATLAPGTSVTNVRVVWPRWYHRPWLYLKSFFGRRSAQRESL